MTWVTWGMSRPRAACSRGRTFLLILMAFARSLLLLLLLVVAVQAINQPAVPQQAMWPSKAGAEQLTTSVATSTGVRPERKERRACRGRGRGGQV